MKKYKTREVKVIQSNYGYGWDDEAVYERDEYHEIKEAFKEYLLLGGSYRVITRRVPNN